MDLEKEINDISPANPPKPKLMPPKTMLIDYLQKKKQEPKGPDLNGILDYFKEKKK